ncbi:MAG: hypothetical protein AAF747_02125 [Planctomycetota bacterium]
MRSTLCRTVAACLATLTVACFASQSKALQPAALIENLTPEQAARYEIFDNFRINGVCGTSNLELAKQFGINTIRGYTINLREDGTIKTLDEAHALGMKVIVSEWMPHHGENTGRDGAKWNFDYTANIDERLAKFTEKVDAIGDHPAILMWGLGNEVHLDREYLEYVNLMSLAIHERFPLAITSLTMINAKPDNIRKIAEYAPDLDVIGVQSYSLGAVRGGIRNMEEHWGKPYYYSEFNGKGPWNFQKTTWGSAYEDLPAQRSSDIKACLEAFDDAPRCLGSTAFVWGHFGVQRPSYFSLLLSHHPGGFDAAERAGISTEPLITSLTGIHGESELTVAPGEQFSVRATATDADDDNVRLVYWIIGKPGGRYIAVSGPIDANDDGVAQLIAANSPRDDCLVMVYALDDNGGASATTIPVRFAD